MKLKERIVYLITISALLGALYYYNFYTESEYETKYKKAVEQYTKRIDSLKAFNESLDSVVDSLENTLNVADSLISAQDKEIDQLNEDLDEEINNVDLFGHHELTSFFSNRYNSSSTSGRDSTSSN